MHQNDARLVLSNEIAFPPDVNSILKLNQAALVLAAVI